MTMFWFASVAMSVVVLVSLLIYVKYARLSVIDTDDISARAKNNLDMYKKQVDELALQLDNDSIDQATYESLVLEAKKQLLSDTETTENAAATQKIQQVTTVTKDKSSIALILVTAVLIPVAALALYLPKGFSLGSIDQWQVRQQLDLIAEIDNSAEKQQSLYKLASLLEYQVRSLRPDESLQNLLAEVYASLGLYQKATELYTRLLESYPDNADLYASLAELLYLQRIKNNNDNQQISERIGTLLDKALTIEPQQLKALSLSGILAFEAKDWQTAIRHWTQALQFYPPQSSQAQTIQSGITSARQKLADNSQTAVAPVANNNETGNENITAVIKVEVSIEQSLLSAEDDVTTPVFVFARPASGARMPLAAKRIALGDLPTEITLSNNDSMAGQSIDGHQSVIVGARLARSEQPIPQPGDIESSEIEVEVNILDDKYNILDVPAVPLYIEHIR